ncbi:hypothetical protein MCOR22_005563 [Pyricularia oryzae]|nr:hypothetical protein MCOR22_005563 [Pyricularia oryzae]
MQLLNIVLPLLLAGLVSAQAQCFDDLDCLFSGIENAKCAKATNTDLLGAAAPCQRPSWIRADPLCRHGATFLKTPLSRREGLPSLPPPLLVRCAAERAKLQSFKGYARARDFFRGMCNAGQQFPRGTAVFINLGSAIAYMCNYDVDNRCWRQV